MQAMANLSILIETQFPFKNIVEDGGDKTDRERYAYSLHSTYDTNSKFL